MLMLIRTTAVAALLLGLAVAQEPVLDAADHKDHPAEGLVVAERVLAEAVAAAADDAAVANLRYQAALIAGYAEDQARARRWLQAIVEQPGELLVEQDGRMLYRRSLSKLRRALFESDESAAARTITLAALAQVSRSSALSRRDRAELAANIRLTASDRGISTEDYRASLEWLAPVFDDAELLLTSRTGAGAYAWAGRQRALFSFELGEFEQAFTSLDRVAEQLEEAAPILNEYALQLVALLRTRELLLAGEGGAAQVEASIQKAERLVTRMEAVQGEARPGVLRSACNVVRMIATALGEKDAERRVACLDRVVAWLLTEPGFLDPEFGALSNATDIARHIYEELAVADIAYASVVDGRLEELFAAVERAYGGEAVAGLRANLASSRRRLEYVETQHGLIGRPAPDLAVAAVVHEGQARRTALTWEDLRGKVVLLEFWNVHCGPCIAGFPHLAALERRHAEQGFVVLGQTGFYKLRWDVEAKNAVEDDTTTEEQELDMLVQFAEHRNAQHRFVVTSDPALGKRYGILANPTAFLVDRAGNVRAAFEGVDLESPEFLELLDELLGEK